MANGTVSRLREMNVPYVLLDGDSVRRTLSKDLGFSNADRRENMRRLGRLAHNALQEGKVAVVAAISPLRQVRQEVRGSLPAESFVEIYVDAPLAVCESRDPKGLYQRARRGLIKEFTGIDSAYEAPTHPEVHLYTNRYTPWECIEQIFHFLENRKEPSHEPVSS